MRRGRTRSWSSWRWPTAAARARAWARAARRLEGIAEPVRNAGWLGWPVKPQIWRRRDRRAASPARDDVAGSFPFPDTRAGPMLRFEQPELHWTAPDTLVPLSWSRVSAIRLQSRLWQASRRET